MSQPVSPNQAPTPQVRSPDAGKPLIVLEDCTVLAETRSSGYEEARSRLLGFAELVKSPEHVHTYRLTPLSVWNARASGMEIGAMIETLSAFSRYALPRVVRDALTDWGRRFGLLKLVRIGPEILLESRDEALAHELWSRKDVAAHLPERLSPLSFRVEPLARGRLKVALIKAGWPALDLAGYTEGEPLALDLRGASSDGLAFGLRPYQRDALNAFVDGGSDRGGSGVVVLPCGAGKTIVGLAAMAALGRSTLILCTGVTAARQWIREALDKTSLRPDDIGEYGMTGKDLRPVTVVTYQMLTHRRRKGGPFTHMEIFSLRDWGLIIYDEVHLLPAPVFQVTADLQARRRLGLTATLVREDGREDEVFALIGPKKTDLPWKTLENQGWIAKAVCAEIRVPLPPDLRLPYAMAEPRAKFRMASENPLKADLARDILARHPGEPALVIGLYLDQIKALARLLDAPLLTGQTPASQRERLYEDFRRGRIQVLAVSKVANFSVDLPDASVAIQVSGTFGSRQEEAQRLGRILRPKPGANQAHFYSLVSRDTVEQDFAMKRQLFLCEQGYPYRLEDAGGTS